MNEMPAIAWYDQHAATVATDYEAHDPMVLHGWMLDLLPPPGLVLDVGAGTGRDAAWLAGRGLDVIAVEPSQRLRERAEALHPVAAVRWLDDRLPELHATSRLDLRFDLVWLSAVWQHVLPTDRPRAFHALTALLEPGGVMLLTLRHGPADPERAMYPVSVGEVEVLARAHGLAVVRVQAQIDRQGRTGVSWTGMALRLPDNPRRATV